MNKPPSAGQKTSKKGTSRYRKRRRRKTQHQHHHNKFIQPVGSISGSRSIQIPESETLGGSRVEPVTSGSSPGFEMWKKTYENLVRWQINCQLDHWKLLAKNLKRENDYLRNKLKNYEQDSKTNEFNDEESQKFTSSESESDEDFEVDEKYLEFMAITEKHRESVRMKKEMEKNQTSKN